MSINGSSVVETIPFLEISFGTTHEGMWDLTSCEVTKELTNSIYLYFEKSINVIDSYVKQ